MIEMWREMACLYRERAALETTNKVTRDMLLALAREADGVAQDEEERMNQGQSSSPSSS